MKQHSRININIDKKKHRDLKAKLAKRGMYISDWIRDKIDFFLAEK